MRMEIRRAAELIPKIKMGRQTIRVTKMEKETELQIRMEAEHRETGVCQMEAEHRETGVCQMEADRRQEAQDRPHPLPLAAGQSSRPLHPAAGHPARRLHRAVAERTVPAFQIPAAARLRHLPWQSQTR